MTGRTSERGAAATDTSSSRRDARSAFVNSVAWSFIAFGSLGTLVAGMQAVMLQILGELYAEAKVEIESRGVQAQFPQLAELMVENSRAVVAAYFAFSLLAVVFAIGLLRRKNWARLGFIGLLVLGVLASATGVALQSSFLSQLEVPRTMDGVGEAFRNVATVVRLGTVVVSLSVAAMFGWLVWRLRSPEIAAEFRPERT